MLHWLHWGTAGHSDRAEDALENSAAVDAKPRLVALMALLAPRMAESAWASEHLHTSRSLRGYCLLLASACTQATCAKNSSDRAACRDCAATLRSASAKNFSAIRKPGAKGTAS